MHIAEIITQTAVIATLAFTVTPLQFFVLLVPSTMVVASIFDSVLCYDF